MYPLWLILFCNVGYFEGGNMLLLSTAQKILCSTMSVCLAEPFVVPPAFEESFRGGRKAVEGKIQIHERTAVE